MMAAIYARKSTDQTGVNEDEKSVARQVENAKVAQRKGPRAKTDRPESEWITVECPELRIVPEDWWERVQAQLKAPGDLYVRKEGKLQGRPGALDRESPYLLSGFATCAVCGGSVSGVKRGRHVYYVCTTNFKQGTAACPNKLAVPAAQFETALIQALSDALDPAVVRELVSETQRAAREAREFQEARKARLNARIVDVQRQLDNLADAISQGGGAFETLVDRSRLSKARSGACSRSATNPRSPSRSPSPRRSSRRRSMCATPCGSPCPRRARCSDASSRARSSSTRRSSTAGAGRAVHDEEQPRRFPPREEAQGDTPRSVPSAEAGAERDAAAVPRGLVGR